jgi:branched-chain amino acid transport system substrate-binding protein
MMRKYLLLLTILMLSFLVVTACSGGDSPTSTDSNETRGNTEENTSNGESDSTEENEPIVIGSTMALTGSAGHLGSQMKETFEIFAKEINENGGINGRELKLIFYDDENSPEKTVQNLQRLIHSDKVKVILGPSTAQTSGAAQPVADEEKVLVFSLSSAYTPLEDSFVFNGSLGQLAMHQIQHEWFKLKGFKKIGLIATNDASGDISAKIVNEQFNNKDGIEYYTERMDMQAIDVTPELTRLRSKGIEALVIIGPGAPPAVVIKNAGQLGLDIPLLLTHSQASYTFANTIKDYIPDQLYLASTAPIVWEQISEENPLKPVMERFGTLFREELGKELDHVTAVGFDSIYTVVEAIKKAGTDDPKTLKNVLENEFKNFPTSTAMINYSPQDHQGSTMDGAVIVRLAPGIKWELVYEPKFWEE